VPLVTESLGQQVYEELKQRIVTLKFKLGEKLNISTLTKEFRVSQTPVREALHKLARDGLIKIVSREGFYVIRPTVKDMEEVYDLRVLLESYALKRGMEKIDKTALIDIGKITVDLQQWSPIKDTNLRRVKFDETDRTLHKTIINATNNQKLITMYNNIYLFVIMSQSMNPDFETSIYEHLLLIDAILEQDVEKALKILEKHIEGTKLKGLEALKKGIYYFQRSGNI